MLQRLAFLAEGQPVGNLVTGKASGAGKVAFLFTGQGSQRPRMGADLYEAYPVFAEALDAVCEHLDPHFERPLKDVMFAASGTEDADRLNTTLYTQPALFALETALYRLFEHYGLRPAYLIGHSIGEITAAHVAGVLSLPDACELVAARSRLMQALPGGGAMVSIHQISEEVVRIALEDFEGHIDIAAVNGPSSVVISGDEAPVIEMAARFKAQGHKTKRLKVSHAFHSPHMEPMLQEFEAVAARLTYEAPRIPVISNVTGRLATAEDLRTPRYWVDHVRGTVRFGDGMQALQDLGTTIYLELGPDAVLTPMASACLSGGQTPVPVLRARKPEAQTMLVGSEGQRLRAGRLEVGEEPPLSGGEVEIRRPHAVRAQLGVDVLEAGEVPANRDQVKALLVLHVVLGDRLGVGAVDGERDADIAARLGLTVGEGEGVAVLGDHQPSWCVGFRGRLCRAGLVPVMGGGCGFGCRADGLPDAQRHGEDGRESDKEAGDPGGGAHASW